jgi:hypothetical protein
VNTVRDVRGGGLRLRYAHWKWVIRVAWRRPATIAAVPPRFSIYKPNTHRLRQRQAWMLGAIKIRRALR